MLHFDLFCRCHGIAAIDAMSSACTTHTGGAYIEYKKLGFAQSFIARLTPIWRVEFNYLPFSLFRVVTVRSCWELWMKFLLQYSLTRVGTLWV